jgi:D-galactose 1-dehydrogenase
MLAQEPAIEAVAVCTPPGISGRIALDAIAMGKHVLLEKPPCATLGEFRQIGAAAARAGTTVMASWHSRFGGAVEIARAILADEEVAQLAMTWKEDAVAVHPAQSWMWQPRGFGVREFGINGISLLTRVLAQPLVVAAASLYVPAGAATPIAAELDFAGAGEHDRLHAELDWRAPEERTIEIITRSGRRLWTGRTGQHLEVDGVVVVDEPNLEYQR